METHNHLFIGVHLRKNKKGRSCLPGSCLVGIRARCQWRDRKIVVVVVVIIAIGDAMQTGQEKPDVYRVSTRHAARAIGSHEVPKNTLFYRGFDYDHDYDNESQ